MLAIVLGWIAAGTLVGAVGGFWVEYGMLFVVPATDEETFPMRPFILDAAT